jgi:aminopeptidase S
VRSTRAIAPVLAAIVAASALTAAPTSSAASVTPSTAVTPFGSVVQAAAPDIPVADVQAHLAELQSTANENGGNRGTGEPGYLASLTYVESELQAAGFTTTTQSFSTSSGTSYNLLAELPGGDPDRVVMMGAHLDSVASGPGINDNGTGTAAVLEAALEYAASGQTPRNSVRVGLWGAEELGLLGSTYYVDSLSTAEREALEVYLNDDMVGSPNPGYFVYDDNPAGDTARDEMTDWYDDQGIPWEYIDVQGGSDHAAFRAEGIATSGIFSGAESRKTSAQAQKWGGTASAAFDPCYHRSCDTISNVDATAPDRGADLVGHML